MTKLITRDVDVIRLPLGKATLLHPERCIVKVGNETADLGALCYLRRADQVRRGQNKPQLVDPNSLLPGRRETVRRLIEQISQECKSSGRRHNSVFVEFKYVVRFIGWCDRTGHVGIFGTAEDARRAFREYVAHLKERIRTNDMKAFTAAQQQNALKKVLNEHFGIDTIHAGVHLVVATNRSRTPTPIPDSVSQGKVLSLCECLFTGFRTHVLENNPYPFKLILPHYLGWDVNALWIFPVSKYCMAPHEIAKRDEMREGYWAYDYQRGRIATLDEVVEKYLRIPDAREAIKDATKLIIRANDDKRDINRIDLAMVAHNAFVLLFMANTGMNWSVARALPWGSNYKVGKAHQGFREIKYRAKGKETSFEIQSVFLPKFQRFLKLREYLLNGRRCGTLFVSLGDNRKRSPKQIRPTMLTRLFDTLHRIDPTLRMILTRQWRAAKADWGLLNTDAKTTADLLGNSESTTLKSYAAGSPTRQKQEFHHFYSGLTKTVLRPNKTHADGFKDSAIGECKNYGKPHAKDPNPPITPDCKQSEGCLFCDKYVVHADVCDIRKLMSCRMVLYRTAHFSNSEEHFKALFGEVLNRIQALLDAIAATSKATAKHLPRIQKEVENDGILDPYWEGKLQMLINLGEVSA